MRADQTANETQGVQTFREWIRANVADFNTSVKNEEDLKIKCLLPYLAALGYTDADLQFNRPIDVQVGTRKVTVFSDVDVLLGGAVQAVIDTKDPRQSVTERDIIQSASYAKLVSTPSALLGITTNGIDVICTNVLTGQRTNQIPTRARLVRDVDRAVRRPLSEVELREVKSALITLLKQEDLFKVIRTCKDLIEKKGLIRSDQSFREMTKILLVKMSEERRAKGGVPNRFLDEWVRATAAANRRSYVEVFGHLFDEAKHVYPSVYTDEDDVLRLADEECLSEVVKLLEEFSFLGTGDDIKGAVYEIFLKSTLRGELDQYFTPREIVDFMVKYADPEPGEVVLDPACGSGGFLIQVFRHVNQKIINSPDGEVNRTAVFKELIESGLWGHEGDYDLHVLAKINLIMHGDGWNHIYRGDTLTSPHLPKDHFDLVLTNPPFTIQYAFPEVLSLFEQGLGRQSQELDILFVEKSIDCLTEAGELYIVLPEGMLNTRTYVEFRRWLMRKCHLIMSVSLPEGAFIPFGKSVSKTCIIGLRKKRPDDDTTIPKHVFCGRAREIGYESGKRDYKATTTNDLQFFLQNETEVFEGIRASDSGGECGWCLTGQVSEARLDANYLLNTIDRTALAERFPLLVPLGELCSIENEQVTPATGTKYRYLEVPDITEGTGTISNLRVVDGLAIGSNKYRFVGGDILFVRINPRISRVTLVPDDIANGVVSTEVHVLRMKPNEHITDAAVLAAILQSDHVRAQAARIATGSSSSRARVHEDDLPIEVLVPVPNAADQAALGKAFRDANNDYWRASQRYADMFELMQTKLDSGGRKGSLRRV